MSRRRSAFVETVSVPFLDSDYALFVLPLFNFFWMKICFSFPALSGASAFPMLSISKYNAMFLERSGFLFKR